MFQNTKQLILKVTRDCNIRCKYCYVLDKDKYWAEQITDDMFDNIVDKYFSECNLADVPINLWEIIFSSISLEEKQKQIGNIQPIQIVLHGGEPLLLGKERISRFLKVITQKARKYKKFVTTSIQTNGILIDRDWLDIFRRYRVSIGVSWDGYGESSDNRAKGDDVLTRMILMLAYNQLPGVLHILHKKNHLNIIENMKILDALGVKQIKINRGVDITNNENFELNADELFNAAQKICYFMWSNPGRIYDDVLYQKMRSFVDNISYGEPQFRGDICYTRYCGAGNFIMEIEPDGSVLLCGRNAQHHEIVTQHIDDRDMNEIFAFNHMLEFQKFKMQSVINNKCNLCNSQTICDYGCMSFSYQKFNGEAKIDDITCQYNKLLYNFFNQHYNEIVRYCDKVIKREPCLGYFT